MRLLAFVACLLVLSGCQRSNKRVIAVIPKGTSHVFWVQVETGARAAEKQFGVEVVWNGPPQETEFPRQIQILDSMVARRVDGIALAAGERTALVPAVERAIAAGIPLVVFDSGLDTDKYVSFIATNNYEGGALGARALGKLVGGKGKVGLIRHTPGSTSTMDREKGFEDTISKEFPGIQIAGRQYSMSDRAKGRASTENILTANPDLNGIFCSAEPGSVGAALAINARGLSGKVRLVTFDANEGMVDALKGGTIDAMVIQDPFKIGFQAVKTVVDKLNGQTPPKRIDLSARVVTKADLDNPEVQKLLFPKLP